ncbi:hypothetical protein C0J52_16911 [Blattella germanica]|nr:hypothetical protein C0J52_16911 [Blattella germanica]
MDPSGCSDEPPQVEILSNLHPCDESSENQNNNIDGISSDIAFQHLQTSEKVIAVKHVADINTSMSTNFDNTPQQCSKARGSTTLIKNYINMTSETIQPKRNSSRKRKLTEYCNANDQPSVKKPAIEIQDSEQRSNNLFGSLDDVKKVKPHFLNEQINFLSLTKKPIAIQERELTKDSELNLFSVTLDKVSSIAEHEPLIRSRRHVGQVCGDHFQYDDVLRDRTNTLKALIDKNNSADAFHQDHSENISSMSKTDTCNVISMEKVNTELSSEVVDDIRYSDKSIVSCTDKGVDTISALVDEAIRLQDEKSISDLNTLGLASTLNDENVLVDSFTDMEQQQHNFMEEHIQVCSQNNENGDSDSCEIDCISIKGKCNDLVYNGSDSVIRETNAAEVNTLQGEQDVYEQSEISQTSGSNDVGTFNESFNGGTVTSNFTIIDHAGSVCDNINGDGDDDSALCVRSSNASFNETLSKCVDNCDHSNSLLNLDSKEINNRETCSRSDCVTVIPSVDSEQGSSNIITITENMKSNVEMNLENSNLQSWSPKEIDNVDGKNHLNASCIINKEFGDNIDTENSVSLIVLPDDLSKQSYSSQALTQEADTSDNSPDIVYIGVESKTADTSKNKNHVNDEFSVTIKTGNPRNNRNLTAKEIEHNSKAAVYPRPLDYSHVLTRKQFATQVQDEDGLIPLTIDQFISSYNIWPKEEKMTNTGAVFNMKKMFEDLQSFPTVILHRIEDKKCKICSKKNSD